MNDFKYVSDQYDINKANEYRLSIQLNPDGFSVLTANHHKDILFLFYRKTLSFKESLTELRENTVLLPVTSMKYARARILVNTPEFTLVPEDLYSSDLKELYYRYNHPLKDYEQILSARFETQNSILLYKLDEEYISLIKSFHNSPEIIHSSIPYIDYIHDYQCGENEVFIHQAGHLLSVTTFTNGSLLLHNIHQIDSDNDVVYHTLNTIRQINVNRGMARILYSGTLDEGGYAMKTLLRYVKEILPLKNEFPFELAGDLKENYFINLLKSTDCV